MGWHSGSLIHAQAAAESTNCIFGNSDICNTFADIGKSVGKFAADAQRELASNNLDTIGADVGHAIHRTAADFHKAISNINFQQAGKDVDQFITNGVADISTALSEFDIDKVTTDVQQFFEGIGKEIFTAIMSVPWEDLAQDAQRFFAQVGASVDATVSAIKWEDLPRDIMDWIERHPFQTIFYVTSGVVFFAPSIVTGPLLGAVGFTPVGPGSAGGVGVLDLLDDAQTYDENDAGDYMELNEY
ncbi:hypothetical protein I303_08649 [Neofusicoccum parvum]|nr:hypothetical protein I303_08649 [Neofusicoccum parvum]